MTVTLALANLGLIAAFGFTDMPMFEEYNPPPNPAKDTDARFEGYQEEFGDSSWELDALDPDVIAELIRDQLDEIVDPVAWAEAQRAEHENVASLQRVSDRWDDVVDFVADEPEEE